MACAEDSGRKTMRKTLLLSAALLALSIGAASAQKPIKIGFVSTFSGPTAVIGNDMRNSFELALDHLGRKIGGQPVEVVYEDDQQKPEVGKQKTEKLIDSDKGISSSATSGRTCFWPRSSLRLIPKPS